MGRNQITGLTNTSSVTKAELVILEIISRFLQSVSIQILVVVLKLSQMQSKFQTFSLSSSLTYSEKTPGHIYHQWFRETYSGRNLIKQLQIMAESLLPKPHELRKSDSYIKKEDERKKSSHDR